MSQALEDGYVECTECGHPVEQHDEDGLDLGDGLRCDVAWTKAGIRELRKAEGLPARFDRRILRP